MATGEVNKKTALSWLNTFLRDHNLQLARVGTGNANGLGTHSIDVATGNWGNVAHSNNKPPRWLFQIDLLATPIVARHPGGVQEQNIGHITTTAARPTASMALRILPLLKTAPTTFEPADDFEVTALFVFHGGLKEGSSSDSISLDLASGALKRVLSGTRVAAPYIFAALLGSRPLTDTKQVTIGGAPRSVSYGEVVDALRAAITVHPQGAGATSIQAYDLSDDAELQRLKVDLEAAWNSAGPPPQANLTVQQAVDDGSALEFDLADLDVPENPDLLGVDPSVYRQINALLRSGKQHIMLYGPPGTGKTTLARWIADNLPGNDWTLVTGSSDWSSQDIIGGYQPVGGGDVDFVPGILLRDFDHPLIIDELNRCDIDKVIGPLFTVLSGQQTTLPYRTDLADKNSQPYVILPQPKSDAGAHEFAPGKAWRLIATINSIDKASLYQMSYALARRFGWVYVDAPSDLRGFIAAFAARKFPNLPVPSAGDVCPLADVWAAINKARVIGSAPIIDAMVAIKELAPDEGFFGAPTDEMRSAILDAIDMVLLPMLDGIMLQDAMNIADATSVAFELTPEQSAHVKSRLETVAI
ncbi:AAA family ATPase [Sphingopyxis sp. DHUNG17]|uniref:AAA family ATPase n=1 Tax=Sphingopyxis jiangsuensis TaxID=2871171 RepID=UPI001920052E|nr:AAA family ATPase [Sphingopyxis lutea]MBL0769569.1 AAA family ATPase [Sphingopyxis lutea]